MIFREATAEDLQNIKSEEVKLECEFGVDHIFALEDKGELLFIGGFRLIVPTTAWAWITLTVEAENKLLTCYRLIREWIDGFAREKELKRLQAFVRNEEKYIRLVKHLGFKQESVMEKFYGEEDALMFKRLL